VTPEDKRRLVRALASPRPKPIVHERRYEAEPADHPVPLATLRPRSKLVGWGKSMDLFARKKSGRT